MCGICGIVASHSLESTRRAMLDSLAHRGPDDEGIYQTDDVFLGHRRLAILDLSDAGHQPMLYEQYVIVFNGEIYNFLELKEELKACGHFFSTQTDTEVVLHAYAEWGMHAFSKFRGMWALGIYDKNEKTFLLSRDRFGIKPLYYFFDNEKLIFASEIQAILKSGVIPKPDMETVMRYLVLGIDDNGRETFFEGIRQLPGAHTMVFNAVERRITYSKYYTPSAGSKAKRSYEDEFLQTVQLHLRSDVKLGTCLSGGLDSSTLAAAIQAELKKSTGESLEAITAKSEDLRNDETEYAALVAEVCGLHWSLAYPTYEDFLNNHLSMLYAQGEPVGSPSVFMQYWVMKKAHEQGIKVMFDGQGGDETLLGYERYYISYLMDFLKKCEVKKFFSACLKIKNNSKLTFVALIKYFIWFSFASIKKRVITKRLSFIKDEYLNEVFEKNEKYLKTSENMQELQWNEIFEHQLPHLLKYEDRNSMRFSIEARVPFVDHVLVENAVCLDIDDKIRDGFTKYCLREIADKYLPEAIAWRTNKRGFEAPEDSWLKKYQSTMQETIMSSGLLHCIVKYMPSIETLPLRLRWRLYNLAIWEKQFL